MRTHTQETQQSLTPQLALEILKEGNQRFVENLMVQRNLLKQVNETCQNQFPFAAILSCIDSRTSAELIFDQGLGDIFSIRIAGNVLNPDILGCMEYACAMAGSKVVVVLGHTNCGAVIGACSNLKLGHFTGLVSKILPSVENVRVNMGADRPSTDQVFIEEVAMDNVKRTVDQVRRESAILREMEAKGEIKIVGGLYNLQTGKVVFFEHQAKEHKCKCSCGCG